MSNLFPQLLAGHVLIPILLLMLIVLALRMADETHRHPRNHLIIAGSALLAFGIVYRLADVWAHIEVPRWSSVAVAAGALAFLAADQQVAARYARIWHHLTGTASRYTGPERRSGPRVGTDPDEDHPRNEER